jgi:parvulin-like peptidyl-prolyl isomerase
VVWLSLPTLHVALAVGPSFPLLPESSAEASVPAAHPVEGGQVVARVGNDVILAADVLVGWNNFLAENVDRIPPEQVEAVREQFMKNQLKGLIDTKLLYADARRKIPTENLPKIEESLGKNFEEEQLPKLYEGTKTSNRSELEAKLRLMGSSLAQQKRSYIESNLARHWLRQQVNSDRDTTHEELWQYYQQQRADFEYKAQARWEEIMVRPDRYATREEAIGELARLGNIVLQNPSSFAEVARTYSHGVTAADGGRYDWTNQGSLVSQILDRAIFTLPVGELSRILEDDAGFHIVRVLDRKEAGCTSFADAQSEIRERIARQRQQEQFSAYLTDLRRRVPVWTLFETAVAPVSRLEPAENRR